MHNGHRRYMRLGRSMESMGSAETVTIPVLKLSLFCILVHRWLCPLLAKNAMNDRQDEWIMSIEKTVECYDN
jgi:hypothetical protein